MNFVKYFLIFLLPFITYAQDSPEQYNKLITKYKNGRMYITGCHPTNNNTECNGLPFVWGQIDLIPQLKIYWPNANYDYEWSQYGICSNISQVDYFNKTIKIVNKLNSTLLYKYYSNQKFIDSTTLLNIFGGSNYALIECSNDNNTNLFTALTTCWDISLFNQKPCPDVTNSIGSCKNNISLIPYIFTENTTTEAPTTKSNNSVKNNITFTILIILINIVWQLKI